MLCWSLGEVLWAKVVVEVGGVLWPPSCLMWCILKERNRRFENKELSLPQLNFLFLRVLYKWSSRSYTFSTFSLMDFLAEFLICCTVVFFFFFFLLFLVYFMCKWIMFINQLYIIYQNIFCSYDGKLKKLVWYPNCVNLIGLDCTSVFCAGVRLVSHQAYNGLIWAL